MSDIRTIFDTASAEQPPLTITRDSAVGAGRRARRRRSLFASGGAAAAVLAVAVGVALLPGYLGKAPVSQHAAAPGPTAYRPPAVLAAETQQQTVARLTPVLHGAVAGLRPGVTLSGDPEARPDLRPGPLDFFPSQGGFKAAAIVADDQGKGWIFVMIRAGEAGDPPPTAACAGKPNPNQTCTPMVGPQGESIEFRQDGVAGGALGYGVSLIRADGTTVDIQTTNWSRADQPSTKNGPAPHAQRPTPPFTAEQLVTLVSNPALSLTP